MPIRLIVFFLILILPVTACTTAAMPVFDTSSIAADARASAEAALESTRVAIQATQTAIDNQPSHLELVQAGDAVNGEVLFNTFQADAGFACVTCHFVDTENMLIGPGLLNVSIRAETRVDGQDAAEYIFNSIVNPDDFVVDTFSADLMPENWLEIYSEAEIYDIAAYLFTLKDGTTASENTGEESKVSAEFPAELETADSTNGETLFNTFQADAGFACSTCHFVDNENRLIGPGLLNIANRAANRVEAQSAYDYIFTSITNPDAYVVDTFTDDLMPENWLEIYSEDEINDIIAYLWVLDG